MRYGGLGGPELRTCPARRSSLDFPETSTSGGATILLVDDDDFGLSFLRRLLREQGGHIVLDANTFDDAEALCAGHSGRIDLLITDMHLDSGSGMALADRLLKLRPRMRVLFISGAHAETLVDLGLLDRRAHLSKSLFCRGCFWTS